MSTRALRTTRQQWGIPWRTLNVTQVWYDRIMGDSPVAIQNRVGYRPFSFWQADVNISATLQSEAFDQFVMQIEETKTPSFFYLTVYPIHGFEQVTDSAVAELAERVKNVVSSGRKVMIRYASEMNGSWFKYGQTPTVFIQEWNRLVNAVRAVAGRANVGFLWAPNSGNGYPYAGGQASNSPQSPRWDPTLDTNGDGLFNNNDDPFTPYYPGDDMVDWVGMSIYHYGDIYPYDRNVLPHSGKFEQMLTGTGDYGPYNFYNMFSGDGAGGQPVSKTKGGKPFLVTETGANTFLAIHKDNGTWILPENTQAEFRVRMKRTWWRQFLDPALHRRYPKLKGFSFFEFIKSEDSSWRDFTNLGQGTSVNSIFGNDGGVQNGPTLEAFKEDIRGDWGKNVLFADTPIPVITSTTSTAQSSTESPKATLGPNQAGSSKNGDKTSGLVAFLAILPLFTLLF